MKRYLRYFAVLTVLALVLAACGDGDGGDTTTTAAEEPTTTAGDEPTTTAAEEPTTTSGEPMPEPILACQVTDTGGIDDKSFNQTAFKGITDAVEAGYAVPESNYLESQAETDYGPNIQSWLDEGCDLIITVGFLLGTATQEAAEANPDQPFEIIDFAYDPEIPNVRGAVFGTTDAAFMAGYLAAGVSENGVVATYGGIQIPCGVTCFMDGFVYGVRYYNQENGTDVQVLGWNPETQAGAFTGDFENADNGRNLTQSFVDEGADVILPVAGPVGVGSAALAQELGNVWVIGVDADWFETLPEYTDVILTSVLKGLDVAVSSTIKDVAEGTFSGGTRVFTIAEDGVGIGGINEAVDAGLQADVEAIRAGLVDGSIVACDLAEGASDSCSG
ncbi:MAG TPA: BMP family ABC transporter substrate-binding protein [Acidimicrobiia bacterium]|nr:BMP family ABC transporter substrate-binding protein [Acidimicrobiia bacterium]